MEYNIHFRLNNKSSDGGKYIQMWVSWQGLTARVNVGYSVLPEKWDAEREKCRPNSFHGPKRVSSAEINTTIVKYRNAAESAFNDFGRAECPTIKQYQDALNAALGKSPRSGKEESVSARSAMTDFIVRQSQMEQWSENSVRKYRTLRDSILNWREDCTLDDLDVKGLEDYYLHLQREGKKNTTLGKYVNNLRTFLKWAETKGGYVVRPDYKDFRPRIKTIPKTIVWLSWQEVLNVYNADLSDVKGDCIEEVRDMFCFSCFTGLRYSDIVGLRHSDVRGDVIRVDIDKTGEVVSINLNKYSRAILSKYIDFDPVSALPQIANATCNEKVKKICKAVGLTEDTTIAYYKGSTKIEETKPKYELITMHTGRRSFICNALEKGISPQVVMKWTGHSSYEEMKPYIDISDTAKETAMKLFDV